MLIGATAFPVHGYARATLELLTRKLQVRQYLVEADIHPFLKGVSFDRG